MQRITDANLQAVVDRLNRATGSPMRPYAPPVTVPEHVMYRGGSVPQAGNYHTDNDGPSIWLVRMGKNTTGTESISPAGTKRELYNFIQAMLIGIELGKPEEKKAEPNNILFTRVNSDSNGNPRYVCHFLNLNTQAELDNPNWIPVSEKYALAVSRSHEIGGRKYRAKHYGGGIVFDSYSLDDTVKHINRITGHNYTGYALD